MEILPNRKTARFFQPYHLKSIINHLFDFNDFQLMKNQQSISSSISLS